MFKRLNAYGARRNIAAFKHHNGGNTHDTEFLRKVGVPEYFEANCSSMGVWLRQGPHHGAQKSTTVGSSLFVSSEKVIALSSFILCSP